VAKRVKIVTAKSDSMSSKHFGKSRIPLGETLQRAAINFQSRPGRMAVLGKPTVEVRVVSPAQVPKPKPKSPPPSVRPKSSGSGGSTRALRSEGAIGLPWVSGPPKKWKAKVQPANGKVQPEKSKVQIKRRKAVKTVKVLRSLVINGKLEQDWFDGPAPRPSRKILTHEGQPRFEGGIRFVQGGHPSLGKR